VRIFDVVRPPNRRVWVVGAGIEGAFDNIDHGALPEAIGASPARGPVRQWLKAGYVGFGDWRPTEAGTPQGGVVSPLLANIALHGLEDALGVTRRRSVAGGRRPRSLVRHADDFCASCETREDAEAARREAARWLAGRGLRLPEAKTRIVHVAEGFDFLGSNVRRHPAPRTARTGWKLPIRPSRDAVGRSRRRVKAGWRALLGADAEAVVKRLNPLIRGWADYHRTAAAKETFARLDAWVFRRSVRWARRRHPNKGRRWIRRRYWGAPGRGRADEWVFGSPDAALPRLAWTRIRRHVLVRGRASPDDPGLRDYRDARRTRRSRDLPVGMGRLADRQRGLCPRCGEGLHNGEDLHRHHGRWRSRGGGDGNANLRLVHLCCHQQIRGGCRHERGGRERLA
jgi:RNA-directed DNA polymerase